MKETLDSLQAAQAAGIGNREGLKLALRAVLCSSKQEWERFDQLFETFWSEGTGLAPPPGKDARARASWPPGLLESSRAELIGSPKPLSGEEGTDNGKAVTGATALERLRRVDFSEIPQEDLPELERAAMLLLRRMALRLSRRLKTTRPRGVVDLRRTIRRSISHGGDPVILSRRGRKLARARLVILLDVSGSMNAYSLFLARFAYALQKYIRRVNTFVFSTRLEEVTRSLGLRSLSEALAALSRESAGWSGGTKIGESLRDFNHRFAARLLTPDTLVMILSDGWDTGEPEAVARELSTIQGRGRQVVWLNPLLGSEDYEPLTRGMASALPFIDVFAPAHNLESLLALEHSLGVVRRAHGRPRRTPGLS
ncbi:MAG: VWA domain-containing protein [Acidobacteria bacterium]|nr:VWA domain-containing protein [Acidobacteriota bacterium]